MLATWGATKGAASNVINAPFSIVNGPSDGPVAGGWYEGITCTYGASHTVSAVEPFTVRRKGYDATGVATTYDDTVYVTRMARVGYISDVGQPVANEPTTGAFSDPVYAQDLIFGGATINSTLAYPPAIGGWIDVPKQLITGSTFRLESYHTQLFARNGRGVACVKHTGNPTTGSAVTKTATYGKSVKYGDAVPCYYTEWSTADFPSNGSARVRYGWECFPWVGDSTTSSTGTYTADITKTNEDITHYTTGPATIWQMYVDGGAGPGTAQATLALAKTTPFATVTAAMTAAFAKSSDASFFIITISAGFAHNYDNTNPSGATRTAKDGWLVIRGDPDDADPYTNCTLTTSGGTNKVVFTSPGAGEKNYLCFRDMTLTIAAATNLGNFSGNTALWRDHVKMVVNVASASQMGGMAYGFATRCDAPTATGAAFTFSGSNLAHQLIRATTSTTTINPNLVISSKSQGASSGMTVGNANGAKENLFALCCQYLDSTTSSNMTNWPQAAAGPPVVQRNIAWVNVVASNAAASGAGPLFQMTEHQNFLFQNIVIFNVTGAGSNGDLQGARMNFLADPNTTTFPTASGSTWGTVTDQPSWRNVAMRNCNFGRISYKFDYFSGHNEAPKNTGSANVLGAIWGVYGVCTRNTQSEYSADTNFRTDLSTSENGYMGVNAIAATAITYTNRATNNFKPTAGARLVPAVDLTESWDTFGTAWATDGTEFSGGVAR